MYMAGNGAPFKIEKTVTTDVGDLYEINPPVLGYSKVEVTGHARERMEMRDIELQEALEVLATPHIVDGLDTQPGRKRYRRNKTAMTALDVVFEERPDRLVITTAIKLQRRIIERKRRKK